MGDPSSVLQTPYPVEPIPSRMVDLLQINDLVSPSYWLQKGIDLVFGFNPGDKAAELFVGDWAAVATASSALTQLAEYVQAMATEVDAATTTMFDGWEGHAADEAFVFFNDAALKIDALSVHLNDLAHAYQLLATSFLMEAKVAASALQDVADSLLMAGISAAAGVASSETGVGALLGGGAAAYETWKATSAWAKVLEAHGKVVSVVFVFTSACSTTLGQLDPHGNIKFPTAYDHPGVTR